MNKPKDIGLVLLAAGASKRLGQPKQLVSFHDKTLLQHAIDCGESLDLKSKVLVIGANSQQILSETDTKSFEVCMNEKWEEGMATSLNLGLHKLLNLNSELSGIMVLVSDQPFVSEKLLNEMIQSFSKESSIVVCKYQEIIGVPTLIGSSYFEEIQALKGDQGARRIIKKYPDLVKTISFDQGNFDIDTPEDLRRLNKLKD